jgi:hypothetical protein
MNASHTTNNNHEKGFVSALMAQDPVAVRRLPTPPPLLLRDPVTQRRMPPIALALTYAYLPMFGDMLRELRRTVVDLDAPYFIFDQGDDVTLRLTPLSHVLAWQCAYNQHAELTFAVDPVQLLLEAGADPRRPFCFEIVDHTHPHESKRVLSSMMARLHGQSLLAVLLQQQPFRSRLALRRFGLLMRHGATFLKAEDPSGLLVPSLSTTDTRVRYSQLRGLLQRHPALPRWVVRGLDPRSGLNLLHWALMHVDWHREHSPIQHLRVLHARGLSVFVPSRRGASPFALARERGCALLEDALATVAREELNERHCALVVHQLLAHTLPEEIGTRFVLPHFQRQAWPIEGARCLWARILAARKALERV